MNFSVFNMGTNPVMLDSALLSLSGSKDKNIENISEEAITKDMISIPLNPLNPEDYSSSKFNPTVIYPENIFTKELVFKLLQFGEQYKKSIIDEGEIILLVTFYNSKGKLGKLKLPIGEIHFSGTRGKQISYTIDLRETTGKFYKVTF